ncbi:biotin transporter BioY [soil metagenome]
MHKRDRIGVGGLADIQSLDRKRQRGNRVTYAPAVITSRVTTRSWAATTALIVGVATLTALAAQWRIPLWPVPITGQTFAVLLGGAALGWRAGGAAQLLYLAVGALGAPVFTEVSGGIAVLTGTTAGYLIGFPVAAALVGWLAERHHDRRFWTMVAAFGAGSAVIYLFGMAGLVALGFSPGSALANGVVPFLVGDALKAAAAGILLPGAWRLLERA